MYHISTSGLFDLMVLNIPVCQVLGMVLFSLSLKSVNISVSDLKRVNADMLRHAVTLTFDRLTLNVSSV